MTCQAAVALAAGQHCIEHDAVAFSDPFAATFHDSTGYLVAGDQWHRLTGENVGSVPEYELGAVEVLFDVGGADTAVVDAKFDLAGGRYRFWDGLQSEVLVAVVDQCFHSTSSLPVGGVPPGALRLAGLLRISMRTDWGRKVG